MRWPSKRIIWATGCSIVMICIMLQPGMVTELKYTDYKTDFVADPNAGNKPE